MKIIISGEKKIFSNKASLSEWEPYRTKPWQNNGAHLVKQLLFIFFYLSHTCSSVVRNTMGLKGISLRVSPKNKLMSQMTKGDTRWMRWESMIWFFFILKSSPHQIHQCPSFLSLFSNKKEWAEVKSECVVIYRCCHGHCPRLPVDGDNAWKSQLSLHEWFCVSVHQ